MGKGKEGDIVRFDVLVKSALSGGTPNLGNIRSFKPEPEVIERCGNWFRKKGVEVYVTPFGLSGRASKEIFESLFKVRLIEAPGDVGEPGYTMEAEPQFPEEIAELVEQMTLSRSPQLF